MPLRLMKVPTIQKQKAKLAHITAQQRKIPRFSQSVKLWMSATHISHGSSEAFSTGSQPQ